MPHRIGHSQVTSNTTVPVKSSRGHSNKGQKGNAAPPATPANSAPVDTVEISPKASGKKAPTGGKTKHHSHKHHRTERTNETKVTKSPRDTKHKPKAEDSTASETKNNESTDTSKVGDSATLTVNVNVNLNVGNTSNVQDSTSLTNQVDDLDAKISNLSEIVSSLKSLTKKFESAFSNMFSNLNSKISGALQSRINFAADFSRGVSQGAGKQLTTELFGNLAQSFLNSTKFLKLQSSKIFNNINSSPKSNLDTDSSKSIGTQFDEAA